MIRRISWFGYQFASEPSRLRMALIALTLLLTLIAASVPEGAALAQNASGGG